MAVRIRQRIQGAAAAAGTSWSINFSVLPLPGSMLICCHTDTPNNLANLPAGWTERVSNTVNAQNTYIWDKVAVGTETGIAWTDQATGVYVGWLYEIVGVTAADVASSGSASAVATVSSGTTAATTAANDWVIAIASASSGGLTLNSLSGLTLDVQATSPGVSGSNSAFGGVGLGTPGNTSGATLSTTATFNSTQALECCLASYKVQTVTFAPAVSGRRTSQGVNRAAVI